MDRPDGILFILTEFHQLSIYCLVTDMSISSVDVWSIFTSLSTALGGPNNERGNIMSEFFILMVTYLQSNVLDVGACIAFW